MTSKISVIQDTVILTYAIRLDIWNLSAPLQTSASDGKEGAADPCGNRGQRSRLPVVYDVDEQHDCHDNLENKSEFFDFHLLFSF